MASVYVDIRPFGNEKFRNFNMVVGYRSLEHGLGIRVQVKCLFAGSIHIGSHENEKLDKSNITGFRRIVEYAG